MPVFALTDEIIFPPVELADESGVLAIGGDLSPERLLLAYGSGIFPWYSKGEPIIWWSPDPRFVLFPSELKISRSMRQVIRRNVFTITCDTAFDTVIEHCSSPRRKQKETWITDEMKQAYSQFHKKGFAHSVEAWKDGKLAGGLYGVSLGRCFFGESMFASETNASKAAFITLVQKLESLGFSIIDCQVHTEHLESLGARFIPRADFIEALDRALRYKTLGGTWSGLFSD